MARTKKNTQAAPKEIIPNVGDTIIIDAALSNQINFEFRNLEMLDGKIMLGKNTATVINVFETLYNTLVQAVDAEYPTSDFLKAYQDKLESVKYRDKLESVNNN